MNTATSPGIQEMLISKGLESFINGSYSEAAGYFEEILSNKPNDPDALHHLAGCQIQLQEYESAQETIQKALNLDSKNSLAWFRLGQIHYLCKRYESAVDSFGKAIEIKPEFADAWFMGGQALIQNSAINDGMLALENALLLNSSSVVFNEIFAKHFIEYKHDVGTLVITGGIGDILLCLPFLLQNKHHNLKINVLTHFKGAKRIFDALSIPVNRIAYYSNDVERLKLQPEIIGPREFYPCPKRWFFDVNPFDSKIIDLDNSRPTLGVQLGGSTISIDLQSKIGLPKKSLPVSLLHSILSLDAFNVILFGSQEEIDSYGLLENDHLHFACYQNIDESLSLVSQCDCFVGSDSAIKSMSAMLQIPTFVWMGDYQDPYRDANFIDVYNKNSSFKVFRYKDINLDLQDGFKELTNYLLAIGLVDQGILELAQKKEILKKGNTIVAVKKDQSELLEAGNYFVSSRGIIKSCNSHNKELRSSSDLIDADLLRNHFPGGSIYICTEAILNFVDHFLGKIDQPFVLVTGDSDIRITDAVLRNEKIQSILANPHLIQWFAQNLDVKHDKLQRMPIGMDYHTMQTAADYWGPGIQSPKRQEDDLFSVASRAPEFSKRSFMAYCNWTNSINSIDRQECITKIQKELCVIEQRRVPRVQSWENQAKHMFVISPEGIGMDCHRTWEALLLGCIPVVKKTNCDEIFDDLPVWIVEDWSEFNSKNLIEKISYFSKKKYNYNKLLLKYWSNKVSKEKNSDECLLPIDQFKLFLVQNNHFGSGTQNNKLDNTDEVIAISTKLNLGCGGNLLDGYLNIGFEDGRPNSQIYLNHDLSKGFPATIDSVEVIYNCHFLEHLEYKDAIEFLRNSFRVMKRGAIMRILVPDLELWCKKYLKKDRSFLDSYRNAYLQQDLYPTDASIFMGMLHNHGHKMGWDYETLSYWLHWAGFKNIRRTKYRESDIEEIFTLEPSNPGRELESLCIECYK